MLRSTYELNGGPSYSLAPDTLRSRCLFICFNTDGERKNAVV